MPLRRKRVPRRRRAPECIDPANAPDIALVTPTAHREPQVHLVQGGIVGDTPAPKVGPPNDLDGLPNGKEALGHAVPGSNLNVNHKLRYPRRHTGASYMDQGVATTPTIAKPS